MRQNPTIYKIEESFNLPTILQKIGEHLKLNSKVFQTKDIKLGEYLAKLIVIESDEKESEWSNFFPKQYTENLSLTYKIPSLLVLVSTKSGIYAIIGGAFYQYILPFLDTSYGLNTYSRLMDPVLDEIISIKTRGVTGLRAGMSEQFKDDYRVMDYIKFGKIPTELRIRLANDTAELLFDQYLSNRSPSIILNISTGFNINKDLSYSNLALLIEILEHVETKKANDFFSSYKEITDDEKIKNSLKPAVINELFNKRADILNNKISNFDICYPNKVEEFYTADEYAIKLKIDKHKFDLIGRTNDKREILRTILKYLSEKGLDRNISTFSSNIYNIYINTYKSHKKKPILRTALIYHLNTELYINGLGTYIYLDSKWYRLKEIFVNEMNARCSEILINNNLNNSVLDKKWVKKENGNREDESSYNGHYDKPNYLILDEITVDSIELADIMKITNDTIYLCHVKYGFSTDIRALYSQIISSARRLKNDLKDEKNTYLKSIFKILKRKGREREFTEKEFVDLFKVKKINYVMAITSHLKNKPLIGKIEKYQSNIAKLSLIQCFTEMRTEYFENFEIEIINNQDCFAN